MENSFFALIEKSKAGNEEAFVEIIYKFEPTIKKFSKELNYEEAQTDLIISLIEIVKFINLSNFNNQNEGAIVNYIYHSMRNKKIDLFRTYIKGSKKEIEINLNIMKDERNYQIEERFMIKDLLNLLPDIQKNVLKEKFIKGYSDSEIAAKLKISRQAVNRAKNRGLKILNGYLKNIT